MVAATSTATNNAADIAIKAALSQIGVPYTWGGKSPATGFDCSGLVCWAYAQAGIPISGSTYTLVGDGTPISTTDRSQWAPGDLIFPDPGHVQLYLGNNQIVEAPHTGATVRQVPEWATVIFAVRRITAPGTGLDVSTTGADTLTSTQLASVNISSIGNFLNDLVNPNWYIRIGLVIFGLIAAGFGLDILTGGMVTKNIPSIDYIPKG